MYDIIKIAEIIGGTIEGDNNLKVKKLAPFYEATEEEMTFASDEKYLKNIEATRAKVVLVPNIENLPSGKVYIKTNKNPRECMTILLEFFKRKTRTPENVIEHSNKINNTAKISPNCYIGFDVEIGEETIIYPNSVIMEGVKIGKNCIIHPNVTIREFCIIGDNVILQPGAVIGSDGFGYINVGGKNKKLEQIGSVVIEDNVEIGANTCVDRGAIGDTIIKNGTKIDNLVHIAHNDIIGENCLIIAQVGISGSVKVGNNCIIAGQTGVAGHLNIGDNVIIAAKSGVISDVPSNSKVSGYPLMDHIDDLKSKVCITKLPQLVKRVEKLEKKGNDKK